MSYPSFTGGSIAGAIVLGVVDTVLDLPTPGSVPEGTQIAVRSANAFEQPALAVQLGGLWTFPSGAGAPTVSYVGQIGGGLGQLPETYSVGAGVDLVLGDAVALESTLTVVLPIGAATVGDGEVEVHGGGQWRILCAINADFNQAYWQMVFQVDGGSGFADRGGQMAHHEAVNLVSEITINGLVINEFLADGDLWRFVLRHDSVGSEDVTVRSFRVAANVIRASST